MIVNNAGSIAEQNNVAASDVNAAARLGPGYPQGPLEQGGRIGPARILDAIDDRTRDPRCRAGLWLRTERGLALAEIPEGEMPLGQQA